MTDKRLIDAGTLKVAIGCNDAVKYGNKSAEQQHDSYSTMMMYEIADIIDDVPEVDAVPVVHAQWMLEPRERCIVVCSNCHAGCFSRTPYCPLCGAKMDGGVGK